MASASACRKLPSACAVAGGTASRDGPAGSANAATHSPAMPITLSVVNSDCVPAPSLTPSQFTNVSNTMAAAPTPNSALLGRCSTWQK